MKCLLYVDFQVVYILIMLPPPFQRVQNYLIRRGVATSHSSLYNPTEKLQVERFNGVIWRTIRLVFKTRKLPTIVHGKVCFLKFYILRDRFSAQQLTLRLMNYFFSLTKNQCLVVRYQSGGQSQVLCCFETSLNYTRTTI